MTNIAGIRVRGKGGARMTIIDKRKTRTATAVATAIAIAIAIAIATTLGPLGNVGCRNFAVVVVIDGTITFGGKGKI